MVKFWDSDPNRTLWSISKTTLHDNCITIRQTVASAMLTFRLGIYAFPLMGSFQKKMPKTLGKNTNVSNRSFLGYSLFNLVHHSQTTHKKLHLKYNWKLIFFLLYRELYATRIKVIGMSVSLSWPLFKAASQVWSQAGS